MIVVGKRTLLAKTCLMCRVLKMADQFVIVQRHYRDSYCRSCHNEHGKPGMQRHQQESLKRALSHRQPWSVEELKYLSEMVAEGLSGPVMALELNRSVYAVYTMKNRLKETPR